MDGVDVDNGARGGGGGRAPTEQANGQEAGHQGDREPDRDGAGAPHGDASGLGDAPGLGEGTPASTEVSATG